MSLKKHWIIGIVRYSVPNSFSIFIFIVQVKIDLTDSLFDDSLVGNDSLESFSPE